MTSVGADSPAAKAGVRAGEVITAVDARSSKTPAILAARSAKRTKATLRLQSFETSISAASLLLQSGQPT